MWLAAFLILWLGVVHAAEITGIVTDVHDGDTITVLGPGNQQHTIRWVTIAPPRRGSLSAMPPENSSEANAAAQFRR